MKKIFIFFFFLFIPIQSFSIIYPIEPKYVSLKKNKVFSRWNASFEAPIRYVYHKKGLPVLIIRKKDNWRRVRDIYGDESWIHRSMISNKKTFINRKEQNLIKYVENKNSIIAITNSGVVGRILKCNENYCKVKIKGFKGWLKKEFLWGIKQQN